MCARLVLLACLLVFGLMPGALTRKIEPGVRSALAAFKPTASIQARGEDVGTHVAARPAVTSTLNSPAGN